MSDLGIPEKERWGDMTSPASPEESKNKKWYPSFDLVGKQLDEVDLKDIQYGDEIKAEVTLRVKRISDVSSESTNKKEVTVEVIDMEVSDDSGMEERQPGEPHGRVAKKPEEKNEEDEVGGMKIKRPSKETQLKPEDL